jgi:hypothetical protein
VASWRWLELPATLVSLAGLVAAVVGAIGLGSLLDWGGLSALGILLVAVAGVVEKRRTWLVARLGRATGFDDDPSASAPPRTGASPDQPREGAPAPAHG